MTDQETSAAVEALAHRLRNRDAAVRDGEDYPDAEPFALEFLTALRGQGWRPTAAKAVGLPMHAAPVPDSPPRDELLASLRADMDARAARDRAAKEGAA